jgi:predicted nucleic acid-binding protein
LIVLDASAVVDLLLAIPPFGDTVAEHVRTAGGDVHAPHLLDVEVAQTFRRFILAGDLAPRRAATAVQRLGDLPITRYPHLPFIQRALTFRRNLTVYDALYLVLAEALGATLVTRDGALAKVRGHRASVTLLE